MNHVLAISFSIILCAGCFKQHYDSKWSRICTTFASGFTEEQFDHLRIGMHEDSVKLLIGAPLEILERFYSEKKLADGSVWLWYYSKEAHCTDYNYDWLGREVFFGEDGKVTAFRRIIRRDE
jgi:hypothetical protein